MITTARIKTNVIFNAGGTLAGFVLQFGLLIILARLLSISDYAGYLMAAAIIGVAEMISDFGTRVWAMKHFALPHSSSKVMRLAIESKIIFSLIGGVLLSVIPIRTVGLLILFLSFLIAITQPNTDPLLWNLRGKERLDLEAVIVLAWKALVTLSLAAAAFLGYSLAVLLTLWLISNILRIAFELRLPMTPSLQIQGDAGAGEVGLRGVTKVICQVFPIGVSMFLMNIYSRMGVFVLDRIGTALNVAVYGTAFNLAWSLSFIATSITLAYFPRLSQSLQECNTAKTMTILDKKIKMITAVYLVVCLGVIVLGPLIVPMLYGKGLTEAGMVMVLLAPGLYLWCINFALKFTLNAMGRNWSDTFSVVVGILVFFAAFWSLRQTNLPQAAAAAWGLGEFGAFAIKMVALKYFCSKAISLTLILITNIILISTVLIRYTLSA
ncbi:MAG: oligosaccharide flippase family protein [candidate division WOR-3 bacterium]